MIYSFNLNRMMKKDRGIHTSILFIMKEEDMKIHILYEDNHLIVIEKPVNIPVQEDISADDDLLSIVKADIKKRYNKPGNVYLALIHRLDRPVGGAIIFAKTSKAASRMSDILRKQEVERVYLAIVRGIVKRDTDVLTHYLLKNREKNIVSAVSSQNKVAKQSILAYDVVKRLPADQLTVLSVTLQTGRSHQIRVQLKEIGHPLYGDQKYGAKVNTVGQQIALWSHKIAFIHPVKKERIEVTCSPPKEYPWI